MLSSTAINHFPDFVKIFLKVMLTIKLTIKSLNNLITENKELKVNFKLEISSLKDL